MNDGDKIVFTGKVEQIRRNDIRFSSPRVLVIDVRLNGEQIRDHMWVIMRKKDLDKLDIQNYYMGTGKIAYYINPETMKKDKFTLTHVRSLRKIDKDTHHA